MTRQRFRQGRAQGLLPPFARGDAPAVTVQVMAAQFSTVTVIGTVARVPTRRDQVLVAAVGVPADPLARPQPDFDPTAAIEPGVAGLLPAAVAA